MLPGNGRGLPGSPWAGASSGLRGSPWAGASSGLPGSPWAGASKRAIATGVLASAALASWPLRAEPSPNDARAEALFNAAKKLESGGEFGDACPLFAESKRLGPGVGVGLHLADCYERIGRTASAWEEFRATEQLARERGDEKRANVAQGRARALELRLERLTVATSGAAHEGWQLTIDGAPLPADRWNAALAVDPGDHTVVVNVPGQRPRVLHAHLDAKSSAVTLQVDDGLSPAVSDGAGASTTLAASPSSRDNSGRVWAEVGLVGVTALGAALGSFFMIRRGHFIEEGVTNPPSLADQATTGATVSFVVSGLALTSALVVFFTTPSGRNQVGWTVAPTPLEHGAGAIVRTTF